MAKEFEYDFDVAGATTGEDRQESVNDEPRDRVVYLHRRESDGLPMYVGIGSIERAYSVSGRNDYWRRVFEKHGRIVEILHENLTWEEACAIEIKLIAEYREKYPNTMTNIGNGGETGPGLSGEDHGRFKGHLLFISLCGKYYYICSGTKELEDSGFHFKNVYGTISGYNDYEYVTSKRIHINGKRIRFNAFRFNDVNEITNEMLENRVEAVVSNGAMVDRVGENGPNFKGYSLGVSKSHFVLLAGNKDIESKDFFSSAISACISGRLKHHKSFIWSRIDKNFDRSNLQTLRDLQPYDEDSKDRLEELLK